MNRTKDTKTSAELDTIAQKAYTNIVKYKAFTTWMYEPGLWIEYNELPLSRGEIESVVSRINKLLKGEN